MSGCPYCQWGEGGFVPCTKHALTVVGERWVDPNAQTIQRGEWLPLLHQEKPTPALDPSKSPPRDQDPWLRQLMGRFRLKKLLGKGGMGLVYLAEHEALPKKAAIKLLKKELTTNTQIATRFFLEAKAAAELNHENAVEIYDFGQREDGTLYLIMEFLEGESLSERLQNGATLSAQELSQIVKPICLCLSAAHQKGIIHRDLKPENIFLAKKTSPDGALREQVKVLDFGIAKLFGELAPEGPLTNAGALLGTPAYMPPEQIRCEAVGPRADLYSLGVILYQALTGALPFQGSTPGKLLLAHLGEEPAPLRKLQPQLSPSLESLVLSCLAKKASERPESALALWESYQNALSEEEELPPRKAVRWPLAAVGLFLSVLFGLYWFVPTTKPQVRPPAVTQASTPAAASPRPTATSLPAASLPESSPVPPPARPPTPKPAVTKGSIPPEKKIPAPPKPGTPLQVLEPPKTQRPPEEPPKTPPALLDGGLLGPLK